MFTIVTLILYKEKIMKRQPKQSSRFVGVRLRIPLYDALNKLAENQDRSISYMMNKLLSSALGLKNEKDAAATSIPAPRAARSSR